MVDHTQLAEELFYQLGLRQFGRIGQLSLSPAPRLNQLVSLAVSEESEAEEQTGLSHADIVEVCALRHVLQVRIH